MKLSPNDSNINDQIKNVGTQVMAQFGGQGFQKTVRLGKNSGVSETMTNTMRDKFMRGTSSTKLNADIEITSMEDGAGIAAKYKKMAINRSKRLFNERSISSSVVSPNARQTMNQTQ